MFLIITLLLACALLVWLIGRELRPRNYAAERRRIQARLDRAAGHAVGKTTRLSRRWPWLPLLLLTLALAGCGPAPYDPVRAAREDAEIAQIKTDAARAAELAPLYTRLTALAYVLLSVGAVGAVAYLATLAYLDVRRRQAELRHVELGPLPTPDGRLPVPAELLPAASIAALGATHARLQLAATEHRLDETLTFAGGGEVLAGLLAAPAEE